MKDRPAIPVVSSLLLLLLAVTGCIEFERQTMSFRHDTSSDTLYIFQDYQGILGVDDPVALSEQELTQLNSVLNTQRTFFFNNWITEFNAERLKKLRDTPSGGLDPDPAYEAAIRSLVDLALTNIRVENIGFYFDAHQRLCGAQKITVHNGSKVTSALNRMLSFYARELSSKTETDQSIRQTLREFADRSEPALRLDGNQIEVRWPVTETEFRQFRDQSPQGAALAKQKASISHSNGVLSVAVGQPAATTTSITLPFSETSYSPNAVPVARKHGINNPFDPAAAAAAFLSPRQKP